MQMETQPVNPLGTEKIGVLLRKYAIPSIISLIINSLYNIVDQIFIGHGVGYLGNGATNIVAPIATIAIALSALFGDGLAAIYSLSLGRKDPKRAARSVGNMLVLASIVGILFGAFAFIMIEPLCILFGATDNILPYALRYGRIIALGFPCVIVGSAINSVIRADGSPRYAMFSMMIGAILNTILDPIFIMGFGWGIEGAAIATILSQFVGLCCNIAYLFRFKNIKLTKACFIPSRSISFRIMGLGVASCFNNLAATLIAAISNNLLAFYGAQSPYGADIPVTTFGLCLKVSMIIFSVAIGIASGSQPIIGYNYGANLNKRVRDTYLCACKYATLVAVIAFIAFEAFPLFFLRMFGTETPLYEDFGVKCFRIYLLLTFLNGVQACAGVFFQAIGKPAKAAVTSLSKQFLFILPAMLILTRLIGVEGVLWAGPVADALAFLLAGGFSILELRKLKEREAAKGQSAPQQAAHPAAAPSASER